MLDKTRGYGPLCIKCKQPTMFFSVEVVRDRAGDEAVAIFRCERCDLLTAKSTTGEAA